MKKYFKPDARQGIVNSEFTEAFFRIFTTFIFYTDHKYR